MDTEKLCLWCNEPIPLNLYRSDKIYCDNSCRASFKYHTLYKERKHQQYLKLKKQWERSPVGKRAGLAMREFMKLPKDFRE